MTKRVGRRRKELVAAAVYVLWLDAGKAFSGVCLAPPKEDEKFSIARGREKSEEGTYFLSLMDSIWMKPEVSVGSKPPISSMEDSRSSYRP